jgi:hypothetical protein
MTAPERKELRGVGARGALVCGTRDRPIGRIRAGRLLVFDPGSHFVVIAAGEILEPRAFGALFLPQPVWSFQVSIPI